jgi:hypothetical protein
MNRINQMFQIFQLGSARIQAAHRRTRLLTSSVFFCLALCVSATGGMNASVSCHSNSAGQSVCTTTATCDNGSIGVCKNCIGGSTACANACLQSVCLMPVNNPTPGNNPTPRNNPITTTRLQQQPLRPRLAIDETTYTPRNAENQSSHYEQNYSPATVRIPVEAGH